MPAGVRQGPDASPRRSRDLVGLILRRSLTSFLAFWKARTERHRRCQVPSSIGEADATVAISWNAPGRHTPGRSSSNRENEPHVCMRTRAHQRHWVGRQFVSWRWTGRGSRAGEFHPMNFIFPPETKGACEQRWSQGACKGGEFGSYYVLCGFSVTFSTSSARSGANVHQ